MRYATVCSGIEAPSQAWHSLGWEPVFFSEIEKFPSAVLAHHYPNVPNLGDMTKIKASEYHGAIDLFCGGTPCQSFSLAGLRKGLADPRGNLMLSFVGIIAKMRPRWIIWENVPGVLSSNSGRDFGTFLGALGQLGYGFAYRILDAQFFGVAQRRRRVFVVGYFGDWRPPAAVLFEPESLRGHVQASAKTPKEIAKTLTTRYGQAYDAETEEFIVVDDKIRNLTPVECERLQGFSDNYTLIPKSSDSARYKALGNSMAVPVMQWIGKRIEYIENLMK